MVKSIFEVSLFLIGFEFNTLWGFFGLLDFPPKFLSCFRHSLSIFQNERTNKMYHDNFILTIDFSSSW